MWLSLAHKHGDSAAIIIRDLVSQEMDDTQLDEAGRRLKEWQPTQRAFLKVPRVKANFFRGTNALETGDYKTALRDFRLLAGKGDANAQALLGYMYIEGLGVAQGNSEAAKWYLEAAKHGDEMAQTMIGDMYATGRGVPQDFAKAAQWFRKSAERGVPAAQASLGSLYFQGWGVSEDVVQAHMWVSLAASQGLGGAIEMRD